MIRIGGGVYEVVLEERMCLDFEAVAAADEVKVVVVV